MNELEVIALRKISDTHRAAESEGSRWLRRIDIHTDGAETVHGRTATDHEAGLVVLSGTHDLQAGSGSWAARGLRTSPYEGRPVALFLPPNTPYAAGGGRGEIAVIAACRPPVATPADDRPAKKPLLPLAGSNKVYDGESGSWQPLEAMPDSPEAILPRRIERLPIGEVTVERIFPRDYKATALGLDEVALGPHQSVRFPATVDDDCECAVYYRTEQQLELTCGDRKRTLAGEGLVLAVADGTFVATAGRAYLLFITAGPKAPS